MSTVLVVQLINDNWVKFVSICRLTIFKILFELEDHKNNQFNGIPIYIIPPPNGFDIDQDYDKSSDVLFLKDYLFPKNVCYYGKQTTNVH